MATPLLLEVCVDTFEAAKHAVAHGAHRLELCSRLDVGGLTPSDELINQSLTELPLPLHIMIRPRDGDFCYNETEVCESNTTFESGSSLR
jgi:copper homeostasis protein